MKFQGILFALAALFLSGFPAQAQWRATTACPGAVAIQPAGSSGAVALVDVNGNICISGTFTPSGTQDINITKVGGNAVTTTVPTADAAVLAAVQAPIPAGTNIIGALAANQSVNVAQVNGGTVATGSGAMNAQTPRIALATDSPGTVPLGTQTSPATSPISNIPLPSSAAVAGLAPTSTSALAASAVIKGSGGNLYSFEVAADSTLSGAAWWIMVFNATSLPTNGAVTPAKCYAMQSGTTNFSAAWPTPVQFGTGVTIGVSTTGCFTLTASVHAFISGDAQ
jgi:hypothetical protein